MKRGIAVFVALVVAGLFTLWMAGQWTEEDATGEIVVEVKNRLASGDVAGARGVIEEQRDRLGEGQPEYLEGLVRMLEGRHADAVEPLETAHRLRPGDVDVVEALVAALTNTGLADRSMQVAEAFVASHPDSARVLWMAALACASRDVTKPGAPRRAPERALDYLKRLEPHLEALAAAGSREGLPVGFSSGTFMMLRAQSASAAGQHNIAGEAANMLVQLQPRVSEAWAVLGEVLREHAMATKRYDLMSEAANAYAMAMSLAPDDPRHEVHYVQALLEIPDREQDALDAARALAAKRPADPWAQILLARALVRQKEHRLVDEGVTVYQSLLRGRFAQFVDELSRDPGRVLEMLSQDPGELELLRTVLRNVGIALYDWKQGGQEGEYLKQAHRYLRWYQELGGVMDERIADTWRQLQRIAREPPR